VWYNVSMMHVKDYRMQIWAAESLPVVLLENVNPEEWLAWNSVSWCKMLDRRWTVIGIWLVLFPNVWVELEGGLYGILVSCHATFWSKIVVEKEVWLFHFLLIKDRRGKRSLTFAAVKCSVNEATCMTCPHAHAHAHVGAHWAPFHRLVSTL
jgi:hypothetical protein